MKKIVLIIFSVIFVFTSCDSPTSETPKVESQSPETSAPDTSNTPTQATSNQPVNNAPNEQLPATPDESGSNSNSPENTTGGETTGNQQTGTENNSGNNTNQNGENNTGNTEQGETTTGGETTGNQQTSTENNSGNNTNQNGENNTGNTGQTETPTEPTYERPILAFTDSITSCDLDYRFGLSISNYANELQYINYYFTVDGSEPSVINNGCNVGNCTTYRGQRGNNCNYFANYVPYNADSVTIKAVAYYHNQHVTVASEVVEKTFTIKNYTITYISDLPYSNLPSNRTMKKGQYTLGNIGRYYPDVRGYWFSHFEVNGVRYELDSSFIITENVTIKYCWTEWTYPWYDESDVPSGYTKIVCEPYEYDDINYSNYLAYRVTYNNYIYTFMIEKSSIQKKRANGVDYTYASGTLKKNAVGNNGTLGRQLGSYGFSYGMEPREPTKAKISGTSSSQRVFTTIYTNLNENDHNSVPTEIYVNLSDLRNINF
ncbi:hypothetical protein [Treponema bryantii]|uniref:hypothetical protein n=1 Tax=Treponema bryantii TaxID=163 RepID=UPI0003B51C32|nr:hypothetical protein [Treponema bryantii]